MKKVMMVSMVSLISLIGFAQDGKTTFGGLGGLGMGTELLAASYGIWVDYDKWGGTIVRGAALSNENPTDFIYGNADKFTAGYSFTNIGIHRYGLFKEENISLGAGIQRITDITTNGFERGSTLPYLSLGYSKETIIGVIRFEGTLTKLPTFNIGWGFKF